MASSLGVGRVAGRPATARPSPVGGVGRWAGYLAVGLVALALLGVWSISGVSIGDISRFVAYEALYVLLPGCLLYLLLSPRPGGLLRILALGWPLGYALEIGGFALTAALHVRGAFALLPLVAAITIGPCIAYRRHRARSAPTERSAAHDGRTGAGERGAQSLVAAVAIAIALVLLAFRFFATYPLPEHARSVFYFLDNVEYVSIAADGLHHWPIAEPFLAGHPFRYYTGAYMHIAAVKQVMGVPLAVSVFRLLPATLILVAALQFWCLGGLLSRSRWAGPVTVALLIAVENVKLYPTHTKMFGVALFSEFTWSPSYGFGVVFFLGLLILFRVRFLDVNAAAASLRSASVNSIEPKAVGALVLLGALVLGGGAMKTPAVVTFLGGLSLFWLWRLLTGRLDRLLSLALVLSYVCVGAIYLLMLSGSNTPTSGETEFAPLSFLKYTVLASTLNAHPGLAPLIGAMLVMGLWKILPVAGAVWPLWRRGMWSPYVGLALAIFVVGSAAYAIVGSPNDNQTYFIWFGYIAVIPIAAVSSRYVWGDTPRDARRAVIRTCALAFVFGLAIAGSTQALTSSGTLAGARRVVWYLGTFGLACGVVSWWSWGLERHLTHMATPRGARVALCGVLLLVVLGCAESVTLAVPQTWRTLLDRQAVPRDSRSHPGMTAALYRGLVWVREHTDACDILAANTHTYVPINGTSVDSGYFYYSAFTERRVIMEGWASTAKGQHGEQPYPALYALNSAATSRGDPAAVRALARKGVSYILIDKTHEGDVREPPSVSRLVFDDSALDVYRLTVPVGPHAC